MIGSEASLTHCVVVPNFPPGPLLHCAWSQNAISQMREGVLRSLTPAEHSACIGDALTL
jgi:hypothetical protein